MAERSQLNHTGLDNTLSPVFFPGREEAALSVLSGNANEMEFPDTRDRLAKWPGLRQAIRENVESIAREFDCIGDRKENVLQRLPQERSNWLREALKTYVHLWFGLQDWKCEVELAIKEFDDAFKSVGRGKMSVTELRKVHQKLVRVYSGRDYFNIGGGA